MGKDVCPFCNRPADGGAYGWKSYKCGTTVQFKTVGSRKKEWDIKCKGVPIRQIAQLTEKLENTQAELDEVKSYTVDRDMDIADITARLEAWRAAFKTKGSDAERLEQSKQGLQRLRELGEVE